MSIGLTEAQHSVVSFVRNHIARTGTSPSYAEICQGIGRRSKGSISLLVRQLVERGALVHLPGKSRSLGIPDPDVATGLLLHPLPEVRRAIEAFARDHNIAPVTAAEEALRVYFVEAAGQ